MNNPDRRAHGENVYATKDEHAVSWFQEKPDFSLDLILATGVKTTVSIIDIGGGASRLVATGGFLGVQILVTLRLLPAEPADGINPP